MARNLILFLFCLGFYKSYSQVAKIDTVESNFVFTVRKPPFRIIGFFGDIDFVPQKTHGLKKSMFKRKNGSQGQQGEWYFFNLKGEVFLLKTYLNGYDFYDQEILLLNDIPYEKGSYEIQGEKVVITFESQNDTTYLLGKFRSTDFFVVQSDTMIVTDNWNVGSFVIAKSKEERGSRVNGIKILSKAPFSRFAKENFFWTGTEKQLFLNVNNVDLYQKSRRFLDSLPQGAIKEVKDNVARYIEQQQNFAVIQDSLILFDEEFYDCSDITQSRDSLTFKSDLFKIVRTYERFGVQNYLFKINDQEWGFAQRYQAKIVLRLYENGKVKNLLQKPQVELFRKLLRKENLEEITFNNRCFI